MTDHIPLAPSPATTPEMTLRQRYEAAMYRAKSALENWGRHHPWCDYLQPIPDGKIAKPCNCGYQDALRDADPCWQVTQGAIADRLAFDAAADVAPLAHVCGANGFDDWRRTNATPVAPPASDAPRYKCVHEHGGARTVPCMYGCNDAPESSPASDAPAPPREEFALPDGMRLLPVPFRKTLTVLMTPDDGPALADADVAAVKRGDSTIIRHGMSELYLSQLRLHVARDPSLADQVVVFALDAAGNARPLLDLNNAFTWPPGFGNELWKIEVEIDEALQGIRPASPAQEATPPREPDVREKMQKYGPACVHCGRCNVAHFGEARYCEVGQQHPGANIFTPPCRACSHLHPDFRDALCSCAAPTPPGESA